MTLTRRSIILGGGTTLLSGTTGNAQATPEIRIGALYPMTGPNAQIGLDARFASETALDIINNEFDLDVPLARAKGLGNLGGRKLRIIYADHQGDPQKGRAEAQRLLTQEDVVALIGTYQSAVAVTISETAERYAVPFMSADNSSPTLHRRGLRFFFRAAAHDEMSSAIMFRFLNDLRRDGFDVRSVGLFYEDTIFGTDSANAQRRLAAQHGYRVVADLRYRANSPSLASEVLQLKVANPDVLMPSSYTTDAILLIKTMSDLNYRARGVIAQAGGFADAALYNAVGDKLNGVISKANFALDIAPRRPVVKSINELFKLRSGKDLNDNTARQLMAVLVLADAIDRAGNTDGNAIREALVMTDLPGERTIMPWSRVRFDGSGQNVDADPALVQYNHGTFVTVYPPEIALTKPKWPMSR